ncbi:MAG: hypothetical protein V4649_12440 [Bacteroidota bacterium]
MSAQDDISPFDNNGKRPLPEDKLMAYLDGRLSPAEQHEIEQWLAEDGMESDAIEGLATIHAGEAKSSISRINHKLRKELVSKKRKRRSLKTDQFTWVAIGIILLLVIAGYLVIRAGAGK